MAKVEQTMREKVESYLKDALAENSEPTAPSFLAKPCIETAWPPSSRLSRLLRTKRRTAFQLHAGCGRGRIEDLQEAEARPLGESGPPRERRRP